MAVAPTATRNSLAPATLAGILEPISTEEFLHRYLGKEYFYCPGQSGKFAGLLPWADLNQILEHHRLDVPQLRLVREGKPIPAASFLQYRSNRRVPRVRSAELTRHLKEGATLIVDAMDELQPPITALVENLERQLSNRIQVNMYAGWRSSPGFDLHWDGHDVLILQVSGRKLWKVYSKTDDGKPPSTPLWEGTLNDGDLLYIPRGWWHVAIPLDEPTLHLTVGLHPPTGADLLAWVTERLSPVLAADLPRFGTPDEKRAYLNKLRDAMAAHWNGELLDEYFAHADARVQTRPHFSLPWTATPTDEDWSVKWIVPRRIDLDSILTIRAKGKQWTFAPAAGPLLRMLQDNGTCSIRQLQLSCDLSPRVVRSFVGELIEGGLVTVVPNVLL